MKNFRLIIATVASVFLFASCAGDKKDKKDANSTEVNKEVTEVAKDEVYKIVVTGNDVMKYNRSTITVSAGQKVELTLRHVGQLPKEAMGHNLVILNLGTDVATFAESAMVAMDNDYIPADESAIFVHTKMLGGGESDTITFTAPTEKGEYDFICSFPGHYGAMRGKFIVE
jgi:azurin